MVLDNSSKLKDSESMSKVILNLDLSNKYREDCKKLFADKLKEVNPEGRNQQVHLTDQGTSWGLLSHCLQKKSS